jgi:hypothetical protein
VQSLPHSVFRRATREQSPDPELRRRCVEGIHQAATRLDAAYRLHMQAVSRARAEEAALWGDVLRALRPALPALVTPLLVLDVSSPSRPGLLHLRALLLFGERPEATGRGRLARREGLFLLEDGCLVRIRFTGMTTPTELGKPAFAADRVEGLEARHLLRDHSAAEVADVLARALCTETARRQARVRDAEQHVERLRALRVLLGR